jgi:hypothetical protein
LPGAASAKVGARRTYWFDAPLAASMHAASF